MTAAFAFLAFCSVLSALGVVFSRNAVYSALSLTVNLIVMAGVYLSIGLQFLGVAQMLIYAGAIMVVFLFAVTVLAPEEEIRLSLTDTTRMTGIFVGALIGGGLIACIGGAPISTASLAQPPSMLRDFAQFLFGLYVFPFETTAFILLVALIGAVLLGQRRFKMAKPPEVKL